MRSPYESIPESRWEIEEITDDYIRSRCYLDADRETYVERTQFVANDDLVALNKQQYDDSEGKRWGDGRVVARIPMNVFYKDLVKGVREGDLDHLKWYLNREENRPFRTFRGKI